MKNFIVITLICLSHSFALAESAVSDIDSPVVFMQALGDKVIDIVQTKTGQDKRRALKTLFEEHVYHKKIGQYVLGKHRRTLRSVLKEAKHEEEKKTVIGRIQEALAKFYKTYKKSVIRLYLSAFEKDYTKAKFEATHHKKSGKDGATVYSKLDRNNGAPPISLEWVLRRACSNASNKCDASQESWKVVDLRVESVSQANKERSEAFSILEKHMTKCKQSGGRFCPLEALVELTSRHKSLNKRWKQSGGDKTFKKNEKKNMDSVTSSLDAVGVFTT